MRASSTGTWSVVAVLAAAACAARPSQRNTTPVEAAAPVALPAPPPGAVRFAVVGDYGDGGGDEAAVARRVRSWNPDFVVTTGDNNYPLGLGLTIDDHVGRHYASFIGHYRGRFGPGAAENRFFPVPGNHDWYGPTGLAPYLDYFELPGNERYYDAARGPVHLFALDSDGREPDGVTVDGKQAAWLRQAMAASTACRKFVFMHHPPYSSGEHGPSEGLQWPFGAWGADAVFAGHDHVYERLDVDGVPYFVDGLGGAPRYAFDGPPLAQSRFRFNAAHGAMLVTASEDGVDYEFRDVDDRVVDRWRDGRACARKEAP